MKTHRIEGALMVLAGGAFFALYQFADKAWPAALIGVAFVLAGASVWQKDAH